MLQTRSYGSVEITSIDRDALFAELGRSTERLSRECPEVLKVLLFGSFARGDYTPESDVDLLLIVSRTEVPFLKRSDRYRDFFLGIPLDVNLTVYTREEADRMLGEESSFLRRVSVEARALLVQDA